MKYKTYKSESISSNDAYSFYRTKYEGIAKSKKVKTLGEWKKINSGIWQEVSKAITEAEAGLVIEGLGYFATWRSPVKQEYKSFVWQAADGKGKRVTGYNYNTDHHPYLLTLYTDINPIDHFFCWSMDRCFSEKVRSRLHKNLKRGRKYLLRKTAVKRIYKSRKWKPT